jgi:hypothetical protein
MVVRINDGAQAAEPKDCRQLLFYLNSQALRFTWAERLPIYQTRHEFPPRTIG